MSVLIILITVSIIVASLFLGGFIWAVKKGQFDDDYTPSVRMLFDDKAPAQKNTSKSKHKIDATTTGKVSVRQPDR